MLQVFFRNFLGVRQNTSSERTCWIDSLVWTSENAKSSIAVSKLARIIANEMLCIPYTHNVFLADFQPPQLPFFSQAKSDYCNVSWRRCLSKNGCHFAVRKVRNHSLFESSSSAKMQFLQSETRNARGHGAYWYPARIFLHRSRVILCRGILLGVLCFHFA